MEFEKKWPSHLARACPHVVAKHIEWVTEHSLTHLIPYGVLVRVWPKDHDKEEQWYKSPQDPADNYKERRSVFFLLKTFFILFL